MQILGSMDGNLLFQQSLDDTSINHQSEATLHRQQTLPLFFFTFLSNYPVRTALTYGYQGQWLLSKGLHRKGKGTTQTSQKHTTPLPFSCFPVRVRSRLDVAGGDTSRTGLDNDHFCFMNPCFLLEFSLSLSDDPLLCLIFHAWK